MSEDKKREIERLRDELREAARQKTGKEYRRHRERDDRRDYER